MRVFAGTCAIIIDENVDEAKVLASARVAAGASGALDALSGEQAGELQAFAGLHSLDEHILEGVNSSLGLSLGQVGLLGDLQNTK